MFRWKYRVKMIVRQSDEDLSCIYIDCAQKQEVATLMKSLGENGFSKGPMPSKECTLFDGDEIKMTFIGNITADEIETLTFHPTSGSCSQQIFVKSVNGPGLANRGYLVFTAIATGIVLCKLPIRLHNVSSICFCFTRLTE